MNKRSLGWKLVTTLGFFLVVASILIIYFHAPYLPVLLGGVLALILVFVRR